MGLTHSSIPESAAKLDSFQQNRLCFFKTEVVAQAEAKAHGTKARRRNLNVLEGKCLDHFDEGC